MLVLYIILRLGRTMDLGVLVDNELTFCTHISGIFAKANGVLGTVRRTFHFLDSSTFIAKIHGASHCKVCYSRLDTNK